MRYQATKALPGSKSVTRLQKRYQAPKASPGYKSIAKLRPIEAAFIAKSSLHGNFNNSWCLTLPTSSCSLGLRPTCLPLLVFVRCQATEALRSYCQQVLNSIHSSVFITQHLQQGYRLPVCKDHCLTHFLCFARLQKHCKATANRSWGAFTAKFIAQQLQQIEVPLRRPTY